MARIFLIFTVALFALIGFAALRKNKKEEAADQTYAAATPVEIEVVPIEQPKPAPKPVATTTPVIQEGIPRSADGLPTANRIHELFNVGDPRLPLVETVTYKSRVPWLKGRPAWISDYASHYETSRHFIARSLNGKPDYVKQDVADGNRFNVLNSEKEINFHLVVDVSRCKMWFYAIDKSDDKKYLLKTYDVGLGRMDPTKASGLLTPLGTYSLGDKIAIYKPNVMGYYNGEKTEMIRIFGTRWIPFEKEVSETTAPARGFGIHGVPWAVDAKSNSLAEERESVSKYDSDGCIRLLTEDIEEIFSIVITKPTTIELVSDYSEAKIKE